MTHSSQAGLASIAGDTVPTVAPAIERLRVAMLGTTDGDFIDPDSEVPAGEMFRLAAEALPYLLAAPATVEPDRDTIARIRVERGTTTEFPVAERIKGGWQTGVHFYPDESVTEVLETYTPDAALPTPTVAATVDGIADSIVDHWLKGTGMSAEDLDAEERDGALALARDVAAADPRRTEAEVKAEELGEAAATLAEVTEGPNREGTASWSESARDTYSLAIEEAAKALRDRAARLRGESS